MKNTQRFPVHEDELPSTTLSGDIKERLQVKPEEPMKKRPAGEEWTNFESVDRMGALGLNSVEGTKPKFKLELNNYGRDPSYDNDEKIQHDCAQNLLSSDGFTKNQTLKEHFTDERNEMLYEEVEDKETGNKGLLYRNNLFDRY